MRYQHFTKRSVHSILSAAVIASLLAPAAEAKFISKPLSICDQGSFFTGGVPKTTFYSASRTTPGPTANAVQITIGQVYVSFQKPANAHKWPVIIWHGSTHSGACVESTPHGTEGWRDWTVRKGLSTYVIDQAGRGRSGNDNSIVMEQEHDQAAGVAAANTTAGYYPAPGRITDNGSWTAWFGHLIVQPEPAYPATLVSTSNLTGHNFSGAAVPAGNLEPHGWDCRDPSASTGVNAVHPTCAHPPVNDEYAPAYALSGPAATTVPQYPNSTAPGDNLVWLGPSGQGPLPVYDGERFHLNYYKQLLPNYESTLPSAHCGACAPKTLAQANVWSPFGVALLVEKLGGGIVGTHSQSGIQGHHTARILKERGHLDMLKGLITVEGSCSLANAGLLASDFDNTPYLALKGDYSTASTACAPTVVSINASATHNPAVKAESISLDDPSYGGKFNGVPHMMMDGTDNLDVMDVILNWAAMWINNPLAGSNIECGNAFLPPN